MDWLNLLEEELIQVQENLSFYNNILEEFITEDIVLLRLNSRNDIIQKSSVVMTIADIIVTVDITVDIVIYKDVGIANDSCVRHSDQYEWSLIADHQSLIANHWLLITDHDRWIN